MSPFSPKALFRDGVWLMVGSVVALALDWHALGVFSLTMSIAAFGGALVMSVVKEFVREVRKP